MALDLLSGDAQTFAQKVWASHVHLHHTDPERLVGLLSLDDVDRLLTSSALRTPALRVVQDGTVLPSSQFTRSATLAGAPLTGLVDGRKVLALFDGGATVVLQGLHRYWPPLTELVRALELELGHPCQANAYLTPPGSQGFARHSDTHDVFVFQTHGHKLWEIVEGDQEREVLLEPGLSMYLPTGTPHSARSQEVTSLHVTLGINQVTWRQALRSVIDGLLAEEEYDAPLPAGFLDDPATLSAALGTRLDGLARQLADADPDLFATAHATRFLTDRTPVLAGGLVDLVGLADLDDATRVERRPTSACVLREEAERLVVLLGDRQLRMPARLRAPLEFVRDHPSFTVGELAPWLDEGSRLVVVRRLVREGLLRIARDR
ncbi:cupin domain-containing protein [Nocardioides caldifontis]|uniref:cupin domain-containing protein n=1 Tax=Nocardioides caldifontis TaxID=2588938 RepID=UPI0011E06570|nr:cupin domain-containing protein [Nocardioides caldifontis]